jgi:tetratricopeptide (TPR) repeat protein
MKKLLTILVILVIALFIGMTLYVFELPPFQSSSNTQQQKAVTQQTVIEMPDFLTQEKIERVKSFGELMNKGKLLVENGYPQLAIAQYEAASRLSPQSIEPLIEIGRIHLRANDYLRAKVSFEAALQIEPDNIDTKVYLVRALLGDRKVTEAQQILTEITVDNQKSKYYKGLLAAYLGDYETSKNLFKDTVSLGTSDDITKKAQNFLAAYDEYNSYQEAPKIQLKTLLARSFNQTGEYQIAIPLLYEVIKDKKDYRDAWILLGYSYLNIEKYQDAIDALEEARKLDPQKPETLFFLGLGYYGLNDLNKAAQYLESAKQNGFEPKVQIEQKLAEIYLQLKQYEQSAASYENVLSLNDTDIDYFVKPVWIYLERLKQPQKAVVLAQKAVQDHPDDAMSYNLLGWAFIGTNELGNAEQYLQKAMRMNPNLDAVYLNFGLLYEKKGNPEEAINYFKKAFALGNGNSISLLAAEQFNNLIGKKTNLDYSNLKTNILYQ